MAERFNTVVIGAGQAGLSTGYYLSKNDENFVILDAGERLGDSWRKRWDSLVLFTWSDWNDLPGMEFPGPRTNLPTKDETADYIEQYAKNFSLPVRLGVRVDRVSRSGDRYLVSAGDQQFEADNVVVATGSFQTPRIPDFASELPDAINHMHSSDYKNPSSLPDGDVLVVGAASSGAQIAIELAQGGRTVYLSGPKVEVVPAAKKLIGRKLGIVKWLYSKPRNTFIGNKMHNMAMNHGHPLIGFTYSAVKKAGVQMVGRTAGVRDGKPVLESGEVIDVPNVLWCTGFNPDFSWVDLPVFEDTGYPRHERGVVEEEPGLYFVGLVFLHSMSSQLMLGTGRDAKHVVEQLLQRSSARSTAAAEEPPLQAASSPGQPAS